MAGTIPVEGSPGGTSGKEPACQCRRCKRCKFNSGVAKIPWRRAWQPIQNSCLENAMDRGAWRLQSMRLQRVTYDLATEQEQQIKL